MCDSSPRDASSESALRASLSESALRASIGEAVEQVLETMCFSAVLGPCDTAQAQPFLDRSVSVDYSGAGCGAVLIGCDEAGARSLASNFLGEEAIDEEQVEEFLGELANMVCGAVVSSLSGSGHYSLAAPKLISPVQMAGPEGLRCDFEIDGGILSVLARQQAAA